MDSLLLWPQNPILSIVVVWLVSVGLLVTPALHRLLHRFHMATEEEEAEVEKGRTPKADRGRTER